jgi:hypothetical protein
MRIFCDFRFCFVGCSRLLRCGFVLRRRLTSRVLLSLLPRLSILGSTMTRRRVGLVIILVLSGMGLLRVRHSVIDQL